MSPKSRSVLGTVSDAIEKKEFVRSTIITVIFSLVFLILGVAFWYWSTPEVIDTSPVNWLLEINSFLVPVVETLLMVGFFIALITTIINSRLYFTEIRAGWLEIIFTLILATAISWAMFDSNVGIATLVISIGFVVYLYMLQD
ncbi:MAG: hypothetical protein E3J82_03235 [Candidatus Thorarchaeota archaeon]|nr:MAG: hypothetical protein E3J82_03235 [Candidatus Thorarchaeota archaeon]